MSQPLGPGREIGSYRVETLLGQGGMSVVYAAEDLRLGRRVALKILDPQLASDEAFRTRFIRESHLAAGMEHPNIVPVYDAGEAEGHLYIVMRLVDGTDMRELLSQESPLAVDRTVGLLRPIASALDAAHRRGLVHRDVKPANILISYGGGKHEHPYLSDFGLTKHTTSRSGLTKTGQFMGTIDYVAPEQIQGLTVDGRTDQYSLACVVFESLTGSVPFRKDNDLATLFGHLQDPPPRLTEYRPTLPTTADVVLSRAMAKDREERYETCLSFLDALADSFEEGRQGAAGLAPVVATVAAPPPPRREPDALPVPPPTERYPPPPAVGKGISHGLRLGILSVGLAAVVAAVGFLVLTSSEDPPTGPPASGADNPTPTSSPSPADPTLFALDDFSDPDSGWKTRLSERLSAQYVGGSYEISLSLPRDTLVQELKGRGPIDDVSISVDAQPVISNKEAYYGVTCRDADPGPTTSRTYYFLVSTRGDYAIGIYDFASTTAFFEDLVSGTSEAINQGLASNQIHATCEQRADVALLSLAVNGRFVDSVEHSEPLPAGRLGLSVESVGGSTGVTVAFDNFEARRI